MINDDILEASENEEHRLLSEAEVKSLIKVVKTPKLSVHYGTEYIDEYDHEAGYLKIDDKENDDMCVVMAFKALTSTERTLELFSKRVIRDVLYYSTQSAVYNSLSGDKQFYNIGRTIFSGDLPTAVLIESQIQGINSIEDVDSIDDIESIEIESVNAFIQAPSGQELVLQFENFDPQTVFESVCKVLKAITIDGKKLPVDSISTDMLIHLVYFPTLEGSEYDPSVGQGSGKKEKSKGKAIKKSVKNESAQASPSVNGRKRAEAVIEGKIAKGKCIEYGHYRQSLNASNVNQPIQWIVLDIKKNKALLICLKAIEYKPFGDNNNDWEKSKIRRWLNREFYNKAFSPEEQQGIATTSVVADYSPLNRVREDGPKTRDKLFLLSLPEVTEYFPEETNRICEYSDYVSGLAAKDDEDYKLGWWLRSPGIVYDRAARVSGNDGAVYNLLCSLPIGVRPAMWIDTDAICIVNKSINESEQTAPFDESTIAKEQKKSETQPETLYATEGSNADNAPLNVKMAEKIEKAVYVAEEARAIAEKAAVKRKVEKKKITERKPPKPKEPVLVEVEKYKSIPVPQKQSIFAMKMGYLGIWIFAFLPGLWLILGMNNTADIKTFWIILFWIGAFLDYYAFIPLIVTYPDDIKKAIEEQKKIPEIIRTNEANEKIYQEALRQNQEQYERALKEYREKEEGYKELEKQYHAAYEQKCAERDREYLEDCEIAKYNHKIVKNEIEWLKNVHEKALELKEKLYDTVCANIDRVTQEDICKSEEEKTLLSKVKNSVSKVESSKTLVPTKQITAQEKNFDVSARSKLVAIIDYVIRINEEVSAYLEKDCNRNVGN